MNESQVKEFYSELKFPGPYSIEDLSFYDQGIYNNYLYMFDNQIKNAKTVLDVGCGSGFIVNLLARRYPNIKFVAVDFSNSINYARNFSQSHGITNITYYNENFLNWNANQTFDIVICNGVLHHIPEYELALNKIKTLADSKIIIGIYNSFGKIAKKYWPVMYKNDILYQDQEHCPFEISFTHKQFKNLFKEYQLLSTYPGYKNHLVDFYSLFNYINGGLVVYTFSK